MHYTEKNKQAIGKMAIRQELTLAAVQDLLSYATSEKFCGTLATMNPADVRNRVQDNIMPTFSQEIADLPKYVDIIQDASGTNYLEFVAEVWGKGKAGENVAFDFLDGEFTWLPRRSFHAKRAVFDMHPSFGCVGIVEQTQPNEHFYRMRMPIPDAWSAELIHEPTRER